MGRGHPKIFRALRTLPLFTQPPLPLNPGYAPAHTRINTHTQTQIMIMTSLPLTMVARGDAKNMIVKKLQTTPSWEVALLLS